MGQDLSTGTGRVPDSAGIPGTSQGETVPRRAWIKLLLRLNLFTLLLLAPLVFVFSGLHTWKQAAEVVLLVAIGTGVNGLAMYVLEDDPVRMATADGLLTEFRLRRRGLQVQVQRLEAERDALIAERKGLQSDHNDSKLATLQATLKSHFIFNTLNAIVTLIQDEPEKAEEATLGLARVLRAILEMRDRPLIPLRAEIAVLEEYVRIEKIRLGARMQFAVDAQEGVLDMPVPSMILQPLVENAIQHGICQRRDGGTIQLRAFAEGERLHLEIIDNGPGISMYAGNGQAMMLIRERLSNLYDDQSELRLERNPTKRETIVSAVIPYAPLRVA
jgi:signal transduction histidine kinase